MEYEFIEYGERVRDALDAGKPVVAVETGFLYHRDGISDTIGNALDCLRTIRENGAVPAVIAIEGGKLQIGMEDVRLVDFLHRKGVVKCNTRDIAIAVAQGLSGTTTVSAAAFAAGLAGIPVLTAGGIGGVHRNAAVTFDISADLMQLARTSIVVVCSGAKSILDIPLTLEYLETHGIAVVGYGTADFPAYYMRESGCRLEFSVEDPGQVADIVRAKFGLSDGGALVVANPVAEEFELDRAEIDGLLQSALLEAEKDRITGKKITAYLLDRIIGPVGERASAAARAIMLDNAALAARIAAGLAASSGT